MNIGIFDSGVGGLTIFKEILKKLPQYNYIYYGDTARVPYGGRSSQSIYQFTLEAVEYLFKKDCIVIILACNTATAVALRKIQREYLLKKFPDRRVLGVIRPTVEEVAERKFSPVGVIGTKATVKSESFVKEIHKLNSDIEIFQQACSLLVPFIEEKETKTKAFTLVLNKYLEPLKQKNIKALILGCTHYGHIKNDIKKIMGRNVKIIDEAKIVADKLIIYLKKHKEIEKRLNREHKKEYYFTDKTIAGTTA